jgi:hypothetical protein
MTSFSIIRDIPGSHANLKGIKCKVWVAQYSSV